MEEREEEPIDALKEGGGFVAFDKESGRVEELEIEGGGGRRILYD